MTSTQVPRTTITKAGIQGFGFFLSTIFLGAILTDRNPKHTKMGIWILHLAPSRATSQGEDLYVGSAVPAFTMLFQDDFHLFLSPKHL